MTTITTTNLSWSVNDSIGNIDTCVSNTLEQSSVFDDQKKDTIQLSNTAQSVQERGDSVDGINGNGTIDKIYNALGQIISSSTTSDEEKWRAYESAFLMSSEMCTNGVYFPQQGSSYYNSPHCLFNPWSPHCLFNQKVEDSPFMQKINATWQILTDVLSYSAFMYDGSTMVVALLEPHCDEIEGNLNSFNVSPLEAKLLTLQARVVGVDNNLLGAQSSSFSIDLQEKTIQTKNGTSTSFSLSTSATNNAFLWPDLRNHPLFGHDGPVGFQSETFSVSMGQNSTQTSGGAFNDQNSSDSYSYQQEILSYCGISPKSMGFFNNPTLTYNEARKNYLAEVAKDVTKTGVFTMASYNITEGQKTHTVSFSRNIQYLNAQLEKEMIDALFNTSPKKTDKTNKKDDQAHKAAAQQNTSPKVSPYPSSLVGQNPYQGNNTPKTPTTSLVA